MLIYCLAKYEPKSPKLKDLSSKDTQGKLTNHFKKYEGILNPCVDALFSERKHYMLKFILIPLVIRLELVTDNLIEIHYLNY